MRFPSLDPQRDPHHDDRGSQCEQPSKPGLPVIQQIEPCREPRHHAPGLRSLITLSEGGGRTNCPRVFITGCRRMTAERMEVTPASPCPTPARPSRRFYRAGTKPK